MFQNTFQVKHYNINNVFVDVIPPEIIKNEITFTAQKNGGQGQLNLVLNLWFTNNNFSYGEYIRVYVVNDYHPSGYLLYSGYIHDINFDYDGQESIELSVYGLWSLLTDVYYKSGGNLEFTQTDDPADIIKDVLVLHNTVYTGILSEWDISNYGTTVAYNVSQINCFDTIKNVVDLAEWYYWYIDQRGKLDFKPQGSTQHIFTYGKHIDSLTKNENSDIYNKLYLYYDWANKTYTDAASIALYWVREMVITDTTIDNVTTADAFAANYFAEHANPIDQVDFTISMLYKAQSTRPFWEDADDWDDTDIRGEGAIGSFELIKPGQMVKINNIATSIVGQVEKITYWIDKMQISLNKFDSFINLIKN